MSIKYVVGYDGSDSSRRAVDFALDRAKASGASLVVAHVLEWSPYSFLTPEELEERHKRRGEELARAESAVIKPLVDAISGKGVEVETVIKYGHIADTLSAIAKEHDAAQIFLGRQGETGITARIFGSVAGSMVQSTPVPCTIVP
ncbi:MAG: universal stress protein [Brucellaceae bacterium]|nr:universal stress protein [Brucellaceae bacterium]